MENRPGAVDLLLSLNCQLTTNLKGYTAMDFALQNKFAGVALVMVTHPTRYVVFSSHFIAPNLPVMCPRGLGWWSIYCYSPTNSSHIWLVALM